MHRIDAGWQRSRRTISLIEPNGSDASAAPVNMVRYARAGDRTQSGWSTGCTGTKRMKKTVGSATVGVPAIQFCWLRTAGTLGVHCAAVTLADRLENRRLDDMVAYRHLQSRLRGTYKLQLLLAADWPIN